MKSICIFCSSSRSLDETYHSIAGTIGRELAKRKIVQINGAGEVGLMGTLTREAVANGGKVIGVIPEKLNVPGIVSDHCTELVVTKSLAERKKIMFEKADAFLALPGGYGTLEELLEVITLKQLKYFDKKIFILNINGFYDPLVLQFEKMNREHFISTRHMNLFGSFQTVDDLLKEIFRS